MATVYAQTVYDIGLGAYVRYVQQLVTPNPNPATTTPVGVGPFDASTHRILQQVETHQPQIWFPVATVLDLPSNPSVLAGDMCWVTADAKQYVYTGAAWQVAGGGGGAKKAQTYVVGNALEGDLAADCDFLDPGDGTGLELALNALYGRKGIIFVRRGTYTRAANAPVYAVDRGQRIIGEGFDATVFVPPTGDAGTLPWQLFSLVGYGAEVTDIAVNIPDRSATVPTASDVLAVFRIDAPFAFVRRVAGSIGTFTVTNKPLAFIAVNSSYAFRGQVIEDVLLSLETATIVADAGNPFALIGVTSGGMDSTALFALTGDGDAPTVRRFNLVYGKCNEVGTPYYTIGMAFSRTSEVNVEDCRIDGAYCGFYGKFANPAGTLTIRGPAIQRLITMGPTNVAASLIPSGVSLQASPGTGALTIERTYIRNCEFRGGAASTLAAGAAVQYGDCTAHDVAIESNEVRTDAASGGAAVRLVTNAAVNCDGAIVSRNRLYPGAGGTAQVDVIGVSDALVSENICDTMDFSTTLRMRAADNRVRTAGGINVTSATSYSLNGNVVG